MTNGPRTGAGRWEIVAILVVLAAVVVFGALGALLCYRWCHGQAGSSLNVYLLKSLLSKCDSLPSKCDSLPSKCDSLPFLCCSFVAVFRQSAPAGPIGPKGGPPTYTAPGGMAGRGPPPMAPARGPPVPAVRT